LPRLSHDTLKCTDENGVDYLEFEVVSRGTTFVAKIDIEDSHFLRDRWRVILRNYEYANTPEYTPNYRILRRTKDGRLRVLARCVWKKHNGKHANRLLFKNNNPLDVRTSNLREFKGGW